MESVNNNSNSEVSPSDLYDDSQRLDWKSQLQTSYKSDSETEVKHRRLTEHRVDSLDNPSKLNPSRVAVLGEYEVPINNIFSKEKIISFFEEMHANIVQKVSDRQNAGKLDKLFKKMIDFCNNNEKIANSGFHLSEILVSVTILAICLSSNKQKIKLVYGKFLEMPGNFMQSIKSYFKEQTREVVDQLPETFLSNINGIINILLSDGTLKQETESSLDQQDDFQIVDNTVDTTNNGQLQLIDNEDHKLLLSITYEEV